VEIRRNRVIHNMKEFALAGSGIVVGAPGVGKTHTLFRLQDLLTSEGIPFLFLPIDQLGDGSEADLRSLLSFDGDLVDWVASSFEDIGYGIVIFDSYDAARSETVRNRFATLIRRFNAYTSLDFTVIVAVRTYDAVRSRELRRIFGSPRESDPSEFQSPTIDCRHFLLPLLSDDEVSTGLKQIGIDSRFLVNIDSALLELLRYPFNLWLIDRLFQSGFGLKSLGDVVSQTQLLSLFWEARVTNHEDAESRHHLLTSISRLMVDERRLSVRKESVFDPSMSKSYESLLSDEILIDADDKGQRLSYSHNILFDFSVSQLLLEDEAQSLVSFLAEDKSRPFFLLPSLLFHMTDLWFRNRDTFWNCFWSLRSEKSTYLRLFSRIVPTRVLVSEARVLSDLLPLIHATSRSINAASAIIHTLQALRSTVIKSTVPWAEFARELSESPQRAFFWELAAVIDQLVNVAEREGEVTELARSGQAVCNLLGWVLDERDPILDDWIDGVTARFVVPLVAKTFKFSPEKSRELLLRVLGLLKEEYFTIEYISRLTDSIEHLWPYDPSLVEEVYKEVFAYKEESEDETQFGGTILKFTSTRRQDFGMCHYHLLWKFPGFLKDEPKYAVTAAVSSLNSYIIERNVRPYLRKDGTVFDLMREFPFHGINVSYLEDLSHIWDQGEFRDEPLKMADEIFIYFTDLAKTGSNEVLYKYILLLAERAETAFFWRRLLQVGALYPEPLGQFLFDTVISHDILLGSDTRYEAGEFIRASAPYLSDEQLQEIEASIMSVPSLAVEGENIEAYQRARDRLLGCIPRGLLKSRSAIQRISALEDQRSIPENRPLVQFGGTWSKKVTHTEWLQEEGVDVDRDENRNLLRFLPEIDACLESQINGEAVEEGLTSISRVAKDLLDELQSDHNVSLEVEELAWTRLSELVEKFTLKARDPEGEPYRIFRQILLKVASHPSPMYSDEIDTKFTFPAWSPTPRNEAAQGLPKLAVWSADDEILDAIELLSRDPVPSVRFLTAIELWRINKNATDRFWQIMDGYIQNEENDTVLNAVCISLGYAYNSNESKAIEILRELAPITLSDRAPSELVRNLVNLIMSLALLRGSDWARVFSKNYLFTADKNPYSTHYAISYCLSLIRPEEVVSRGQSDTIDMVINWLNSAIESCYNAIQTLVQEVKDFETEADDKRERIKELYRIIDRVVLDVYFKLGLEERSKKTKKPLTDDERRTFFTMMLPSLEQVAAYPSSGEQVPIPASTAHNFMRVLNGVIHYDPRMILSLALRIVEQSKPTGYNLDSLAIKDMTQMVEAVLADHRFAFQDDEGMEILVRMLDYFIEAGWPEALNLVWRLDEVYR